jgi:hypothetical protein
MKKRLSIMAVSATWLLAVSVDAANQPLHAGISTETLLAPRAVTQLQAQQATEKTHNFAANWRNVR